MVLTNWPFLTLSFLCPFFWHYSHKFKYKIIANRFTEFRNYFPVQYIRNKTRRGYQKQLKIFITLFLDELFLKSKNLQNVYLCIRSNKKLLKINNALVKRACFIQLIKHFNFFIPIILNKYIMFFKSQLYSLCYINT